MSYVYDKFVFHYIAVDGLVFMCMSDESMQRRLCFAFLEGDLLFPLPFSRALMMFFLTDI